MQLDGNNVDDDNEMSSYCRLTNYSLRAACIVHASWEPIKGDESRESDEQ